MTLITLHIDDENKWAAVKTVLEDMGIAYDIQEYNSEISARENQLLTLAEADVAEERVYPYTSHRDILHK